MMVLLSPCRFDPTPNAPYTIESASWRLLAGTIRGVYATSPHQINHTQKREIYVAPTVPTGVCPVFLFLVQVERTHRDRMVILDIMSTLPIISTDLHTFTSWDLQGSTMFIPSTSTW